MLGSVLLAAGAGVTWFTIKNGRGSFVIASGAIVSGIGLLINAAVTAYRGQGHEEADA